MMLRPLLITAALAAIAAAAAPALAESGPTERPADAGSAERMAEKMRDPATQQAMSEGLRAMTGAMLGIKLGPFLKAMEAAGGGETARDIDPDMTLRDYAGPEAERMPDEMARRLPAMMGAMGEMAVAFEQALPALREMAEEMRARVEPPASR